MAKQETALAKAEARVAEAEARLEALRAEMADGGRRVGRGAGEASSPPTVPSSRLALYRLRQCARRHRLLETRQSRAVPLPSPGVAYWLIKSEPDAFSYQDLVRVKREGWDGVRNYQARIYLRAMRKGDRAIFYHSNAKPPGAAGICKIVKEAEPDPTQFDPASKYYDPTSKPEDPRWDWVTVAAVKETALRTAGRTEGDPRGRRLAAARQGQSAVGDAARRRGVRGDRRRRQPQSEAMRELGGLRGHR